MLRIRCACLGFHPVEPPPSWKMRLQLLSHKASPREQRRRFLPQDPIMVHLKWWRQCVQSLQLIWINRIGRTDSCHDDVIKWKHFPPYWPFVRGIHRQWRGALMFYLICAWINDWVNNCKAGDLRRHRGHYDVTVMVDLHQWHSFL